MSDASPVAPRLLLAGYYGCGNAGDEAILAGLLAGIRATLPDVHLTVASGDPASTAAAHGVETVPREDVPALLAAMRGSDLVIVGGGGIFEDYWDVPASRMLSRGGGGLPYYVGLPALARLAGTRAMICAVGVGPLRTAEGRELTAAAFALAAGATVRDADSHELLAAIDAGIAARVETTADAALLLERPDAAAIAPLRARLGLDASERPLAVALRPWSRPPAAAGWLDAVVAALERRLSTSGERLLVLSFDRGDVATGELLTRRLGEERVVRAPVDLTPHELAGLLAGCGGVLVMRYHAALLALRAGIVPVALAYDPKVAALLAQVGAPARALPPERWTAAEIAAQLDAGVTDQEREEIASRVAGLRRSAGRNVERLREILAGPAPVPARGRDRGLLERLALDRTLAAWTDAEEVESLRRSVAALEGRQRYLLAEGDALRAEREALRGERDGLRAQRSALLADLADATRRLAELEGTVGYRVLSRGWAAARRWLPEGSRRRGLYRAARGLLARAVGGGRGGGPLATTATAAAAPPAPDWRAELLTFADRVRAARAERVVAIFSGTPLDENEGQRPMQLALALAGRATPVVFVYWRWSATEWRPQDRLDDGILQLPIDVVAERPQVLLEPLAGTAGERLALFAFPWPGFFHLLAAARGAGWLALYDVLDDWEEFHRLGQAIWYDEPFERHLIAGSDAVYAINEPLAERVRALGGAGVEVVPNGVRPGIERVHAKRALERGAVTVGYFGHLTAAWFDWGLIAAAAVARPDWRFYLIGYGGDPGDVRLPPNVARLGRQPQRELAAFAASWDVGIVPFRADKLARGADPIKTYEYLAMGLPVVTTGVAPPPGAEAVVQQASGRDDFVAAIERAAALRHDPTARAARAAVAAACTWERRLDLLLGSVAAGRQRVAEARALHGDTPRAEAP